VLLAERKGFRLNSQSVPDVFEQLEALIGTELPKLILRRIPHTEILIA
jgi:hypothetical protein